MASPATAEYLAAWRSSVCEPNLLVEIQLAIPSARTLYLSMREVPLPAAGNTFWQPIIESGDVIESPGSFQSSGPDVINAQFNIFNSQLTYQGADKTAAHSMTEYLWIGAQVKMWFFEHSLPSVATHRCPIFLTGEISSVDVGQTIINIRVIQRTDWNIDVNPKFVDKFVYPRAPEASVNQVIPIIVGRGSAQKMRGEWQTSVTLAASRNRFDRAGGAIATIKGIQVDTGRGGGGANSKAKILFSSNSLGSFGNPIGGTNIFLVQGSEERLSVYTPVSGDIFNSSGGAGLTISDDATVASFIVLPFETLVPTNPARDPRYVLDAGNEANYGIIEYDTTNLRLEFPLADVVGPGAVVEARAIIGYRSIGATTKFKFGVERIGVQGTEISPGASTTPTTTDLVLDVGVLPTGGGWNWSQCKILAYLETTTPVPTGVKIFVHFVAIEVYYRMRAALLFSERYYIERAVPSPHRFGMPGPPGKGNRTSVPIPGATRQAMLRYEVELEGDFYANANGPIDTSGGLYTGTPFAQIERPNDVLSYVLQNFLGQSGKIEFGAGIHGSFYDAFNDLGTWNLFDMSTFLQISKETNGDEIISEFGSNFLSWVFLNRFTDKWNWIAWRLGKPVSYDLTIAPEHIQDSLVIKSLPKASVITGLKIQYLYDIFHRRYVAETSANHRSSSAGHSYLNIRDQYMSIVAGVNDKLNFKKATISYTATLAAGDYDEATLLTAVREAIVLQVSGINVGMGGRIVSGVNDLLSFNDGIPKTAALTPGRYQTLETLATEVALQLNTLSFGWSCSYSRTTKKFTISRSSGTATLTFGGSTSCCAALGYNSVAHTGSLSYVATREVEQEFFQFSADAALELLWETGTDGFTGTGKYCFEVLGFDPIRDLIGANGYIGVCPKSNREQKLKTAKTLYKEKKDIVIDRPLILDTATAREIRDRIVDLSTRARIVVTFNSHFVPDLERGRILQFSDKFDALYPLPEYGTSGSWAGRKFVVIETRQHLGPDRWDTEVTVVDYEA